MLKQDTTSAVEALRAALEVHEGVDPIQVEQVKAELQRLIAPKIDLRRWRPNATFYEVSQLHALRNVR